MEIRNATTDEDISKCFRVMKELRPHLVENDFVPLVKTMLTEGYRLAFIEENNTAVAAIGFRYLQLLYNGKQYYIDDLTTLPESRGKGYGGQLLDYVAALAKKEGFDAVTLDSGHQRFEAHRLYLNKGYKIAAHHFSKTL
jgi:GNAT superfamily N-acetyltransferase